MLWTSEATHSILTHWKQGKTAQEIADLLGNGVTRNAIIGKIARLRARLSPETAPAWRPRPAVPPQRAPARPHAPFAKPRIVLPRHQEIPAAPAPTPPNAPASLNLSIIDLTSRTCHWPVGDPKTTDFGYCGLATDGSSSFCVYHRSIGYQPPQSRTRKTTRPTMTFVAAQM